MRSSLKRTRIGVWIALALTVGGGAWAQTTDQETRAARRAEAQGVVEKALSERMVRKVEPSVLAQDAKRMVKGMTDEQIDAVLAGDELGQVLASKPKSVQAESVASATEGQLQSTTAAVAVGDPTSDLLFVPIAPCRVIDTRLGGGQMAAGETRNFEVTGSTNFAAQGGNPSGCGIPQGATTPEAAAVMINLVAVDATGKGNLVAWQFGQPQPTAASINYANIGMNIANGLIVPISGVATDASDLSIKASFSPVQIVADVTGYFTRFPVENFQGGLKSSLTTIDNTTLIPLTDSGCKEFNSCTVTADADGTVVVEAWGQFVAGHTAGTLDRVAIGIETVSPVVCNDPDSVNSSDFEVPASLGSNPDVDFTVSHGRSFHQSAGTTRTYRLSGQMLSGAGTGDAIENSRLICTFIPD
jgi:hypothetical protein